MHTATRIAHPSAAKDRALFRRLRDPRDPLDLSTVVERYLPLARAVARRHAYGEDTFDDVFQVACFGLLKAIDRFDPDREIAFSSFAVPTVIGEIKRYYRDRTWSVRPPRSLQDLAMRLDRAREDWTAHHGRSPSVAQMAAVLDVDEEDVLEALQARDARSAASLDMPAGAESAGERATLAELVGRPETRFARVEDRALLDGLLGHLPVRDRAIVRMRFDADLTQAEIGEAHGLSQMQISRILRASLDRLRILSRELRAA